MKKITVFFLRQYTRVFALFSENNTFCIRKKIAPVDLVGEIK